jgi:CheY-like chemotaxis protein
MKTVEQPWKGVILYVEDNRPNIDLVQDILETSRQGIRLITTLYGKQAHSLAVENKPDLILLDLNLPDIHGSDVLRTLKTDEMTRNIPVVVIAADAVPSRLNLLLKEGAMDYMTKHIDVDGFLAILDKVFAKQQRYLHTKIDLL